MNIPKPEKRYFVLFFLIAGFSAVVSAEERLLEMAIGKERLQYTVIKAGDNFNFKFSKNIVNESTKLNAGHRVMSSIYEDNSINKTYSEGYIKERARCYVFDSRFHTYTLCFLPNEFSAKTSDRLWGFVTQVPNWKWLLTRFFFPVLLAYALFFYVFRRTDKI